MTPRPEWLGSALGAYVRRPWGRLGERFVGPWRHAWFLECFTWVYVAWSLVPVAIAVMFSFNAGRSRISWQGFSLRWWVTDPVNSLLHDPSLRAAVSQSLKLGALTVLIAVPLGTLAAIGLGRWRGPIASYMDAIVLFALVVPEILLALGFFLTFTRVVPTLIPRGTIAQVIGLVVWQIPYPVIIVRAMLLSIGREYEEAAMDLGASPAGSVRAVLLPLLAPSIILSGAIVFAGSVDNFVIVRYLSGGAETEPVSVKIFSAFRVDPTPAVNAAGTVVLVLSLSVVGLGIAVYGLIARGRGKGIRQSGRTFLV